MDEAHQEAAKPKKDDSCGCAMGAKVMTAAFILSAVFFGWEYYKNGIGLGALFFRTLLATFLAAGLGKAAGIGIYHLKKTINTY